MKKTLSILLLTAFCVAGIFQGCTKEAQVAPNQNYSGEELFRAIYFLQGKAAGQIQTLKPMLEQHNAAIKANPDAGKISKHFADEIIAKIKELDPAFLDQFKEQLASDNYYAKELALSNGVKMISAAGYRSSYAGMFKLLDDMNEKKVDFNSEEIKGLDLTKKEDVEKFKNVMKTEYSINLDDEDYKVACTPAIAICYAIAAVVSSAAVVYTAAVVVNAAAVVTVYAWVELWGGNAMMQTVGQSDALIAEISKLL